MAVVAALIKITESSYTKITGSPSILVHQNVRSSMICGSPKVTDPEIQQMHIYNRPISHPAL